MKQLTVNEYSKLSGRSKQSVYGKIKRNTIDNTMVNNIQYVVIEDDIYKQLKSGTILNTTLNTSLKKQVLNNEIQPIQLLKDENIELKKEIKKQKKEIKKLNQMLLKEKDKLMVEKDESINILKQFISEQRNLLTHKDKDVEIVDTDIEPPKKKKKKKKKKL